jgi:hypothetical protein
MSTIDESLSEIRSVRNGIWLVAGCFKPICPMLSEQSLKNGCLNSGEPLNCC